MIHALLSEQHGVKGRRCVEAKVPTCDQVPEFAQLAPPTPKYSYPDNGVAQRYGTHLEQRTTCLSTHLTLLPYSVAHTSC